MGFMFEYPLFFFPEELSAKMGRLFKMFGWGTGCIK